MHDPKYYMIGKDEYDALPSMFTDVEYAKTLESDCYWPAWVNMFPHKTRDLVCEVEMGIRFNKNTETFVKVYQPL